MIRHQAVVLIILAAKYISGSFNNATISNPKLSSKYDRVLHLQATINSCTFHSESHIIFTETDQRLQKSSLSNISWSHFDDIYVRTLRFDASLAPNNPQNIIAEFRSSYINLLAGAIYDKYGCAANHLSSTYDFPRRKKYITKNVKYYILYSKFVHRFEHPKAIFLWGSIYSSDWQHAVIDFLPLFDTCLSLVQYLAYTDPTTYSNGTFAIPIIVGSYIKYFENIYPFSLFHFIHRNYQHKYMPTPTAVYPIYFEHVYLIDIWERYQSFILPDAYQRILPFLSPNFQYNPSIHNFSYLLHYLHQHNRSSFHTNQLTRNISNHSTPITQSISWNNSLTNTIKITNQTTVERNLVIFLDRNSLSSTKNYNGRQLLNQTALLQAINSSLLPQFSLKVLSCSDWRHDRYAISRAVVILGVHGGHFANMIFAPHGTHIVEFGRSVIMQVLQNRRDHPSHVANSTRHHHYHGRDRLKNPRLVFVGMARSLGHFYWTVEDLMAVRAFKAGKKKPVGWSPDWSDQPVMVSAKQVLDTLTMIGVSKKLFIT
mmetsp:Transcript_29336/g.40317  ORF Transcript_29336/g.40317 Transcript_29336/m.40317 type:complete len:542 (-) Transcript_29336:1360-2985(-)